MNQERRKRLGQVFLINEAVVRAEAAHAEGKCVIEIGPGKGILTRELCKTAKKVIAVEKDPELYRYLKQRLHYENLNLINADFLELNNQALELDSVDIVISNIPYSISSKVISWLSRSRKEAVLCMQKEFVEHMLAKEGAEDYSRLSIVSALSLSITEIMKVPRKSFRPVPKVDSEVVYIKPKLNRITDKEYKIINLLMQHKKKTVRNAIVDACQDIGKTKDESRKIGDSIKNNGLRLFMLSPSEILDLADKLQ